jgi:hypothetical protein
VIKEPVRIGRLKSKKRDVAAEESRPEIDAKTREILSLCAVDTAVMAKTFFPERFYLPFADSIHGEIFKLIDGPDNLVCIAAPRGSGKTSLITLPYLSRHILFGLAPFICYINKSHEAASLQTENLRRELLANPYIRRFFGSVKPKPGLDGFEETFSKKSWVARKTLVWPRGARQQVRGVLHKNSRPGIFILDDLEDPEFIANEDYRKKVYEWLYADVMKAVPQVGPEAVTYKIIYIDTLKHEDSVLQKLLDSPEWKSVRLEACDDDFNPTAPEFLSKEKIQKEWATYSAAGQSDVFFREMRNIPISTKDASFKDEYFRYYNVGMGDAIREGVDIQFFDHELTHSRNIESVVLVDPAKTAKPESADSAIVGIGIDLQSQRIYIRDIIAGKFLPDALYCEAFDMARRLNARVVGWEVTGIEEFIKQPVQNYMSSHGMYFELQWLRARGGFGEEKGKSMRISALIPYYRQGQVFHNRQCRQINLLESQLKMFPRSKRWDVMDATAYIVQMLEWGERYMQPQNLPDYEDDYSKMEYEPPMDGWRVV